jgi:hypothetical protein
MPHSDHSPSPSRDTFSDLPLFPDNVSTAPLFRISLEKLLNHDNEEHDQCWKACCDLGFFYLDLRTSDEQSIDGNALLQDADRLFEVMKGFYDLDVQEKVKYDFKDQGSYFGYKGYGEGVMDKDGTRDRNEFYNVRFIHLTTLAKCFPDMCFSVDFKRRCPRPKSPSRLPSSPQLPPRPVQILHNLLPRTMHARHISPLGSPPPHTPCPQPTSPAPPHRSLRRSNPLRQSAATRTVAQRRRAGRTHGLWKRDGAV